MPNIQQWDGGAHCWKHIKMEYGGKTADATIVDQVRAHSHIGVHIFTDDYSQVPWMPARWTGPVARPLPVLRFREPRRALRLLVFCMMHLLRTSRTL